MKGRYTIDRKTGNLVGKRTRQIMQFSEDFFLNKIKNGEHCFICGESRKNTIFNDEHVIPKWVTKHFGTEKSHLVMHNGSRMFHSHYTVPCCKECNTRLSEKLEKRVSSLVKLGYDGLCEAIDKDESIYELLIQWCALTFFKTHFKDQYLPQDRRYKNGKTIGELHCWHCLHNVLSLARIHYTNPKLDEEIYGSIIILPRQQPNSESKFDYLDHSTSQTIMIQFGDIVIFSALRDSRACLSWYRGFLSRIAGTLTEIQSRELFARLRYVVDNLRRKPNIVSKVNGKGKFSLQLEQKRCIQLYKGADEKVPLFSLMKKYVGEIIPDVPNREKILEDLGEGRAQYILDEHGHFYQYGKA